MKTLVVSVIYKGVEKYFETYIKSIISQNYREFDFILFNDGIEEDILSSYHINVKIIYDPLKKTPAEIRQNCINYAVLNKYDNIIFTDSDDIYSKNRFEKDVEFLSKFDFVFNNICLINENGSIIDNMFYKRFKTDDYLNDLNLILDKNVIGMSNSAVKTRCLENIQIPSAIIAVDWYLFSVLLINNKKGKFIQDSITYYRQHNSNLIGANSLLTKERLLKGIRVKKIHYFSLSEYCKKNNKSELSQLYKRYMKEIIELEQKIKDKVFLKEYIQVINKNFNDIYSGWWSEILTINEWEKYA